MSEDPKRAKVFERLKETHDEEKCHAVELKNKIQILIEKIKDNKDCVFNDIVTELEVLEQKIERELRTFKDNYEDVEIEMVMEDTEKNQWKILVAFREKRNAVRLVLDECFKKLKSLDNKYCQILVMNEQKIKPIEDLIKIHNGIKLKADNLKNEIQELSIRNESQIDWTQKLSNLQNKIDERMDNLKTLLENSTNKIKCSVDTRDHESVLKTFQIESQLINAKVKKLNDKFKKVNVEISYAFDKNIQEIQELFNGVQKSNDEILERSDECIRDIQKNVLENVGSKDAFSNDVKDALKIIIKNLKVKRQNLIDFFNTNQANLTHFSGNNREEVLTKFKTENEVIKNEIHVCISDIKKYLQTEVQKQEKHHVSAIKQEEAREKINKMNTDLISKLCHLKQKIGSIISGQSRHQYIDKDDMNKELTQSLNEINAFLVKAEENYTTVKNRIDTFEDLSEQYESIFEFRNKSEELNPKVDAMEAKLKDIFRRYDISPEAMLARSIRATSEQLGLQLPIVNGLNLFKLPLQQTFQVKKDRVRRFELGKERIDKDHRYVIYMGMTGAGKSLLINNIINYIYGVSLTDKFRFKLIVESEEISERKPGSSNSMAESMTSWVSSFTFHWQKGFRIPFSLTVIDTPGFGDTRGLEFDEKIIDQIRHFFKNKELFPSQELTCLGLVIQSSQARITEEQMYILDQVLNVFGKNMSNNIFIIFTFADAQPPPALEVVKKNKIPFAPECTFKFNNSAVYAPNDDDISSYAWDFGYKSLKGYFEALAIKIPVSLVQTKQVLDERESLRIHLSALQREILMGMETLRLIEVQSSTILQLHGTMKANKNFKVKKSTFNCERKVVSHPITNCSQCSFTCHDPCAIVGDLKSGCAAMRGQSCVVCPSKCHYTKHTNGTNIYIYTPIEINETVEDMMKHYNVALGEKNAKKTLLENMLSKYQEQKNDVFKSIQEANRCANRLEDIALRSSYLSNVQFIERLIQSEERSNRPYKVKRLEHLRYMKDMAETLRDVKANPKGLTVRVSDYESQIRKMINNIKDEEDDVEEVKSASKNIWSKHKWFLGDWM